MNPTTKTAVLRRTISALPFLPQLQDLHDQAYVRGVLVAELDRQTHPIHFDWPKPETFVINGRSMPNVGKGLSLAWMTLATHQRGFDPLPASAYFNGKRAPASATQALARAADALRLVCRPLAEAIDAAGTTRGLVVMKRPVAPVQCTSAWMRDFSRRVVELGYVIS